MNYPLLVGDAITVNAVETSRDGRLYKNMIIKVLYLYCTLYLVYVDLILKYKLLDVATYSIALLIRNLKFNIKLMSLKDRKQFYLKYLNIYLRNLFKAYPYDRAFIFFIR